MKSKLISLARKFRKEMTDAEFRLWCRIRNKQLGVKFRRQCPIDNYIVGFVCLEKRLIIEVDGGQHSQARTDTSRDVYLQSRGFRVLRFRNSEVLRNIEGVVQTITRVLR